MLYLLKPLISLKKNHTLIHEHIIRFTYYINRYKFEINR